MLSRGPSIASRAASVAEVTALLAVSVASLIALRALSVASFTRSDPEPSLEQPTNPPIRMAAPLTATANARFTTVLLLSLTRLSRRITQKVWSGPGGSSGKSAKYLLTLRTMAKTPL
jgi:hypothetical protein